MDALAAGENQVRAGLLDRIAKFDASESWRNDGAATMAQWLVARYGHSQGTATELVRVAGTLSELPETAGVFREGGMSWDQLRAVTRLATVADDAHWAQQAPGMSVAQLNALRSAPTNSQVAAVDQQRHITWRFGHDEPSFEMRTRLLDTDGATVINALTRLANQADPDPVTGIYHNMETRLADALIQLASQSLGADADPDRATVVVRTDLATLVDQPDTGPARLSSGPTLAPGTLERLTCDARLQMVLAGQVQEPVGVGRTTRTIAPWLRRTIEDRDDGCRFPGCERTHWTHVHHIIHWSKGGPTDLDNLILLCGFHHRLVHEHDWRISGDPNGTVVWIQPDGQPLDRKPFPVPLDRWRAILASQPPIAPPRFDPEPTDTS